ncbi:HIT family protein [Sinimarinibacterium sp. NLF-5-8]|uniref:HIT family protein n=1 Tax=Sinimarinibacterium sp. NLF-5-8 TaxID=2698684 RepID=UPI00137C38B2|nr:HIT family protein [Sinimarinibacterium sp. NLF-5-8]QHS11139.1 HIT family protein [Sinimarinibacterium sp. NLF-5-8]
MSVFAAILSGKLPASQVYQDDLCIAFMDIHPITRGHTLVIPRQCVTTLDQLPPGTRAHLWEIALRIGAAQRRALGSGAQHFLVNDGKLASQTVPHVHIHVIPRYGGDTARAVSKMIWHVTTLMLPSRETRRRRARLDALAQQIATALDAHTP